MRLKPEHSIKGSVFKVTLAACSVRSIKALEAWTGTFRLDPIPILSFSFCKIMLHTYACLIIGLC